MMRTCLQRSTIVLTVHIQHSLAAIFEYMKEHTLEKNLSNAMFAPNLFPRKSIFKIIFAHILESDHLHVCIAIKGSPEKNHYKNMLVFLNSFSLKTPKCYIWFICYLLIYCFIDNFVFLCVLKRLLKKYRSMSNLNEEKTTVNFTLKCWKYYKNLCNVVLIFFI